MALYSTDKPIAYTMQNAGWRNVFKPYSISCDLWKTANGTLNENILFSGRTWFDKNGYTTILLSTILRDYTFKHPAKFDNDKQTVVPSTFNALQSNIFPLENENDKSFFTGRFYINVDGTRVATYYVTSLSQQVLTPIPNGETLMKIADYFHVSVDYLLGRTNESTEVTEESISIPTATVSPLTVAEIRTDGVTVEFLKAFETLNFADKVDAMQFVKERMKKESVS